MLAGKRGSGRRRTPPAASARDPGAYDARGDLRPERTLGTRKSPASQPGRKTGGHKGNVGLFQPVSKELGATGPVSMQKRGRRTSAPPLFPSACHPGSPGLSRQVKIPAELRNHERDQGAANGSSSLSAAITLSHQIHQEEPPDHQGWDHPD